MTTKPALVAELLDEAKADPSLLALLDIDKMLDSLETPQNEYLENETQESILREVLLALKTLPLNRSQLKETYGKLLGYRLVEDLHLLHRGKHVRWIRRPAGPLTLGGIVVNIQFEDHGANVVCRLLNGRFTKFRFNDCMTFQKLNNYETLILMLQEQLAEDA
jgi:hypothetical protein